MYLEPWIPPYVSLVGGLVSGRELWVVQSVDIVLPMGLQTPLAPSVLPLTPPLVLPHSVQCLAVCIHICIGQALAEPLRGQLYQAPVSKPLLGINNSDWVWYLQVGEAVSGWPFLQSLLHILYSYFLP